jgi:hypothetical protein
VACGKSKGKGKAGGGGKGKDQRNLSGCSQDEIVEDEIIGDEIVSQNDLPFQDRLGDASIIGNDVDARRSTSNEYFSAHDGP